MQSAAACRSCIREDSRAEGVPFWELSFYTGPVAKANPHRDRVAENLAWK